MSVMRPETKPSHGPHVTPTYADALYMIRDAVRGREQLIHGKLHDHGQSCAIGAFWDANPKLSLPTGLIDEVAMYNDSIPPHISPRTRKRKVLEWLNFKLRVLAGK